MLLDWVNGIPIVGHAKGLVHYAVGDVEGGNKAMKQSTRTTVVMGAGAVGSITGPGGAIALGTATGALWDTVESVVTDEPTGVISGFKKIGDSVSKWEFPIAGALETTLCLGGDAVGAFGGASLVSSFSQSAGKSAATTSAKSIISRSLGKEATKFSTVTHCMVRNKVEKLNHHPYLITTVDSRATASRSNPPENSSQPPPPKPQQDRSSGPTSGGSGQQPPRRNPSNTNEPPQQEQVESFWQEFLDLFEVESLDDISIRGMHIFKRLEKSQKSYLKKIIKFLVKKGILEKVIKTLKNIFNTVDLEDVTFVNFLSLVEIIMQFIGERAARINERKRERQEFPDSYDERRTESIRIACDEILPHDYTIVTVFKSVKDQIMIQSQGLNFRDIFAAVYHYFKHRRVGQVELSVYEYYNLLTSNVEIIEKTKEYEELKDGGKIVIERYYAVYKTRFRIVITKKDGIVILCTGFFLDDYDGTDQDGDMYINGMRFYPK